MKGKSCPVYITGNESSKKPRYKKADERKKTLVLEIARSIE